MNGPGMNSQEERRAVQGVGLLARIASLAEIVTPFLYADGAVVAPGVVAPFVQTSLGEGIEGIVLGLNFLVDSEDYKTSPVSLVKLTAQASGATVAGSSIAGMGPFRAPVARGRS